PSTINNAGHLRGFLGLLYIFSMAFQTSKLFFDVNATAHLNLVATSISTKSPRQTIATSAYGSIYIVAMIFHRPHPKRQSLLSSEDQIPHGPASNRELELEQENQITLSQNDFKKIIAGLKGTIAKGQQTLKKPPGPGKQKANDLADAYASKSSSKKKSSPKKHTSQKKSGAIIDSQIRKIILAMFNDLEIIETMNLFVTRPDFLNY
ncbi:4596_t:CDS:2, partial [Gigaspora rosea]